MHGDIGHMKLGRKPEIIAGTYFFAAMTVFVDRNHSLKHIKTP
jgi:hypothetical protein